MNQDEYQIEIDYSTNEPTENPKYKTTNWQNSFFFSHSAHGHTRFQIKNVIHTIASEIETE